MSMEPPAPPRLEARVESLEKLSLALHARIVELSQDMQTSFRQVSDEQAQMERRIVERMDKLEAKIDTIQEQMLSAFNGLLEAVKASKEE